MNHTAHNQDFYKAVRNNRMLMYSKPKRYFNREEKQGSTFRYLFLIEVIAFLMVLSSFNSVNGQGAPSNNQMLSADNQNSMNIYNYNTVYNSGKVFVSWTSKNETDDCVYVVERSTNGTDYLSVGVKEGIGSQIELYYSWIDQAPPAGFSYYRVKKITKEGDQLYSSVNSIINQASNFNNYAQGNDEK